jgi:hypothetical protein
VTRFPVTIFPNRFALTKREIEVDVGELAHLIGGEWAPTKDRLPFLKLATFGNLRSDRRCLRHDANVKSIFGVEIDYDGGKVDIHDAAGRLRAAEVLAVLYTSASHRPYFPRWRALLPFAGPRDPPERRGWALRAGELLGVEVAQDSLTLHLAYHFGWVSDGENFELTITTGEPIDVRHSPVVEEIPTKTDLVGERGETTELTVYGRAALFSAAKNIINAPNGQQRATLNREGYTIGQAAAAGIVPAKDALEVLLLAANEVGTLDPRRPWRAGEAERIVRRAFCDGWGKPRPSIEQLEAEWERAGSGDPATFTLEGSDAL